MKKIVILFLLLPFLAGAKNLNETPYYKMRYSLFEDTKTKSNIVMLGDSLTDKGLWSEFFPTVSIVNRGISGDTIHYMKARLHQVMYSHPKAVFIMGGVNDIAHKEPLESIISDYEYIVDAFHKKKVSVYVQSTLFVSDDKRLNDNVEISKINSSMQSYCNHNNKCTFIDLNKLLSSDKTLKSNLSLDGVHLNYEGYNLWVEGIKKYIQLYK